MPNLIVGASLFALPFLFAGMIRSIVNKDDEKSAGPLPWCFLIGILFVLIWFLGF